MSPAVTLPSAIAVTGTLVGLRPQVDTPDDGAARDAVDGETPRPYRNLTNLTKSRAAASVVSMGYTVNLYEAKTQLSSLVEQAAAGAEIIIAKAGKPRARLVPLRQTRRRRPGSAKGKIWMASDFDAPLPASLADGFAGTT